MKNKPEESVQAGIERRAIEAVATALTRSIAKDHPMDAVEARKAQTRFESFLRVLKQADDELKANQKALETKE